MMQSQVALADYTYMKVGGPADYLIEVNSIDELTQTVTKAHQEQQRYLIIGSGSNLIFDDKGFRGLIIVNHANHVEVDSLNHIVTAESGAPMNLVVGRANNAGLAGLAGFMGVPGSIGGAIYNNTHFSDKFIGDYVKSVTILDEAGNQRTLPKEDLQFGYDASMFQHSKDVILSVTLELEPGDPNVLTNISAESVKHRRDTQPLEYPSSGCMFKNLSTPTTEGITSAGALIDKTGLKGLQIGGAKVSEKHANFIINQGNATTQDVIDISNQIIASVKEKWGVDLKREVFIINEFGERVNA